MLVPETDLSGWTVTADEGPVDGDTPDCTGAPYEWPPNDTVAHASQFLDRRDESVSLVLKRTDRDGALNIEALRGALAPCTAAGQESRHGAMIKDIGDDSFAYQVRGEDAHGDFTILNMLISCGDLIVEAVAQTYSNELAQTELETLVTPVVNRMSAAGDC